MDRLHATLRDDLNESMNKLKTSLEEQHKERMKALGGLVQQLQRDAESMRLVSYAVVWISSSLMHIWL